MRWDWHPDETPPHVAVTGSAIGSESALIDLRRTGLGDCSLYEHFDRVELSRKDGVWIPLAWRSASRSRERLGWFGTVR